NPFAIRFATQVMSDLPYILVELAALVWADRLTRLDERGARSEEKDGARVPAGATGPSRWEVPAGATGPSRWEVPAPRPSLLRWAVLGVLLALGAYVRTVGEATAVGVLAWAWWRDRKGGLAASAAFV